MGSVIYANRILYRIGGNEARTWVVNGAGRQKVTICRSGSGGDKGRDGRVSIQGERCEVGEKGREGGKEKM